MLFLFITYTNILGLLRIDLAKKKKIFQIVCGFKQYLHQISLNEIICFS